MTYLLDTNICVFVIRRKSQVAIARFRVHTADIGISSVTLAELRYGADKSSDHSKNHAAIDAFLAPLQVLDFDAHAADEYGAVRADLESQGTPIGPLDTMIAAHALSLGRTLVTNNVREFSRVARLSVEDWTIP